MKKDGKSEVKKIEGHGDGSPFSGVAHDIVKQKNYAEKKHPLC